jgi:hypothetical protein
MKRLFLALASVAALWTAACSGGGGTTVLPPPTGKFSLSSLNGTYSFVTNGEIITSTAATSFALARAGSFTANGQGGITAGVEDVNSSGVATLAIQITGGSYTVNADGRGTLTLNLGSGGSINFGLVLTSASGGLMIDETFNSTQASTGSGNFILQTGGPFTVNSAAGPYVFDFSGLDGSGNPDSIVGEFSANSGVVNTGVQDENDNGNIPATPTPVSFTGVLAQDALDPNGPTDLSTFGRGVASLNGINYVFYIVSSNRLRFLSTSNGEMLVGDAVAQNNTIPANVAALNSGFSFIVSGTSGNGGIIRIGRFTATGATVSNVLVDTNNAGTFTSTNSGTSASITLDPVNPGRGTVTFKDPNLSVPFTFEFYLSSATNGVIQDVSQSTTNGATDVADGAIGGQTGSPFSSSNITGTYAMNWSGLSVQAGVADEEDFVGQATVSNLAFTAGAADIYEFQSIFLHNTGAQTDNALTGSILLNGGNGTGSDGKRTTMAVTLTKNGQATTVNFVVYFVSPQLAYFANTSTSSTRIVAGVLEAQP